MDNQFLSWLLVLLPWATIFFMNPTDKKRFMAAAFLSSLISAVVVEIGVTLKWWEIKVTAYPLRNLSYIYGLNPVTTLWVLRFTYKKIWLYLIVDAAVNLFFAYLFLEYFLEERGIFQYIRFGGIHVFLITTITGVVIYFYQMWQDRIFINPRKNSQLT